MKCKLEYAFKILFNNLSTLSRTFKLLKYISLRSFLFVLHVKGWESSVFLESVSFYQCFQNVTDSVFVWFVSLGPNQHFFSHVGTFLVMLGQVFLGWTSTYQRVKCLAQGYNAVPLIRLEPVTPPSRFKHSTTEPPPSSTDSVWSGVFARGYRGFQAFTLMILIPECIHALFDGKIMYIPLSTQINLK